MNRHFQLQARAALVGALLFGAGLAAPRARADTDYPGQVAAGLRHLQAAETGAAAASLSAALRLDANHPAAWTAYGALLLETGNAHAARACFGRAAALDDASPRPPLGLALCDMAANDAAAAQVDLLAAARRGSESAGTCLAYLNVVSGKRTWEVLNGLPASDLAAAIRAELARKRGDTAQAKTEWEAALQRDDAASGGRDPLAAGFDPAHPLLRRWASVTIPMPSVQPERSASGTLPLECRAAGDVTHVLFAVDGRTAAVTNVAPFTWQWDTAAYPNGRHVVRMTAYRADGTTVSQERRIQTHNAGAPASPEYTGMDAVNALLDDALTLRPDPRRARYALARIAIAGHDDAEARHRLEDLVGDDPSYSDAAALLRSLPRAATTTEVWRGPQDRPRIALTFDDGPNATRTPPLLDVLARLRVPATFFVVGKQAALYPSLVRRMAREGHEVENHSWNHPNMTKLGTADALRELASTRRWIRLLIGTAPRFFRPPGGNVSAGVKDAAALLDTTTVMWTVTGRRPEGMPIEDMAPYYIHAAKPGAIYLIHNGTEKIEELLPLLVIRLRAQGYTFVTLSDLLAPPPDAMRTAAAPVPASSLTGK